MWLLLLLAPIWGYPSWEELKDWQDAIAYETRNRTSALQALAP